MKDVSGGLEDLHDECKVIYSGVVCTPLAVAIDLSHCLTDLKPGNILLPSDLDNVLMRELSEKPATTSRTFRRQSWDLPNKPSIHPVSSTPLFWGKDQRVGFHQVAVDLGHGALT